MFLSPATLKLFPNLVAAACCIYFFCLINFWYLLHGLLHNNICSLISHFLPQPFQVHLKKESYFDCGLPLEELHYIWQECEYSLKAICYLCNRVKLSLTWLDGAFVKVRCILITIYAIYLDISSILLNYCFCLFKDCSDSLSYPTALIVSDALYFHIPAFSLLHGDLCIFELLSQKDF